MHNKPLTTRCEQSLESELRSTDCTYPYDELWTLDLDWRLMTMRRAITDSIRGSCRHVRSLTW